MNTRLQVEHPVTEEVTASTSWSLNSGSRRDSRCPGARMRSSSAGRRSNAECREDPSRLPASPGTIQKLELPSGDGIRIESGVEAGSTGLCPLPTHYCSSWSPTDHAAAGGRRMRRPSTGPWSRVSRPPFRSSAGRREPRVPAGAGAHADARTRSLQCLRKSRRTSRGSCSGHHEARCRVAAATR